MKHARTGLALGTLGLLVSVILLLNITAPNPTGRRYSSRIPHIGMPYTINDVGQDGEVVLSQDLSQARNQATNQRQCICNPKFTQSPPGQCRSCLIISEQVTDYRIPDFISERYIAESKNVAQLSANGTRELEQIRDYAEVAEERHIPLWVYVRVNTQVDPVYEALAQQTGGGIVYYYTDDGYIDVIDALSAVGFAVSAVTVFFSGAYLFRHRKTSFPRHSRPTPGSPYDRKVDRSLNAVRNLDQFKEKSKSSLRNKIDIEDSRD